MKHTHLLLLSSFLLLSLGACRRDAGPKAAAAPAAPAQTEPLPTGENMASGIVLETIDAANYTYVRVKTNSGEIWAATSQFKVAVGEKVMVPLSMPMQNFNSPTLKRTFPMIYFSSRIFKEGEMVMPAGGQ